MPYGSYSGGYSGTSGGVATVEFLRRWDGTNWVELAYSPLGHTHGGAPVPYYVPVGETFTVPEYAQALYHLPIEVDGALDVEGLLVEISDVDLSASVVDLSVLIAMEPT